MRTSDRVGVAVAGYAVVAAVLGDRGGPVLCPFRRLTGRGCPVCGLTRSIARTARGDLAGAVRAHRAGPVLGPVLVLLGLRALLIGSGRPGTTAPAH